MLRKGMLEKKRGVLSSLSFLGRWSKLYLKDKLIINYDGLHGSDSPHSFLVPLKKGFYPLRLQYFQQAGGADLQLKYILPGRMAPIDIPHEQLYYDSSDE
ncbi:MAG TPA: hypothetical protein VGB63_14375 [Pedobacter sp.]|jgi:hypothetical protein